MRKSLLILTLALCASLVGHAQNNTTRFFYAYDHEELTVDNTSGGVPFTSTKVQSTTIPSNAAELVTFTVDCNGGGTSCPFRFLNDGTAPTTTVGQLMDYNMAAASYGLVNNKNFKAIRTTSTSAILHVMYWR